MKNCNKCKKNPATLKNPDLLCEPCWFTWWYEDYSNEELKEIARTDLGAEKELVLRNSYGKL